MAKRKSVAKPVSREMPWWIGYATLALIAAAVCANSLANEFITDDKLQLLGNPLVTDIQNLPRVFGAGVWSFLGYQGNYYRPVQFLVYSLLYSVFGPHAFGFHCVMLLLHAVNTALVYAVARRLSGAAWIAGALFAVHPIHTEAVDWIAALPDLLLTSLTLGGLLAFVRQDGLPNRLQSAAHCGLYLLALLTKETGVMLLPLYAGYAWIVLGKRGNLRLYAGMAVVFGIYLALRVHALGGLAPAQQTFVQLGPTVFTMSAAVIAANYFVSLVYPVELNFFHIFHATNQVSPQFVLAVIALAAIAWAAFRLRVRRPMVSYSIFWTVLTLAPALNLVGVGQNVFAERYLYLPSVGFVWLAGMAWAWLRIQAPVVAWPVAAALLVACSAETIARNPDWKDDFTLLQVTLKQSPESGYLHNLMAGAWVERDQFGRALEEQKLAVRYEPRSVVFHKNLGNILLGVDSAGAAREFEMVTTFQPTLAEGHLDLGLAYRALGDSARAAIEFQRAEELRRANPVSAPSSRRPR